MSALSYLSPKAEVRPSAIHGRGLFARESIAKGEIVCIKGGHVFDRRRLAELQPDLGPAEIQITEDLFIGPACACGASTCRGVVTGQDWRKPELQRKYGDYMSWYLLRKMRRERS